MTIGQLDIFFTEHGYRKISSNLSDYCCYFRIENQYAVAVNTMRTGGQFYLSSDEYDMLHDKIRKMFMDKGISDIHILTLIISDNWESTHRLCRNDAFCWMISAFDNRLVVTDSQTPDFYGLRHELEEMLESLRNGTYVSPTADSDVTSGITSHRTPLSWWRSMSTDQRKRLPWIRSLLVVVNVIVFIFSSMHGSVLCDAGGLSVDNIVNDREYYRLFTSLFLHADLNHILSNMLILFYIGEEVEKKIGHFRYAAVYFVSGLAGDMMSMWFELYSGERYSSIGASGAIFGIIGSLLFIVIACGGRTDNVTVGRIAFITAFSLYTGFTSQGVNNAAHVGGLIGGFIMTCIIWAVSSGFRNRIRACRAGRSAE